MRRRTRTLVVVVAALFGFTGILVLELGAVEKDALAYSGLSDSFAVQNQLLLPGIMQSSGDCEDKTCGPGASCGSKMKGRQCDLSGTGVCFSERCGAASPW